MTSPRFDNRDRRAIEQFVAVDRFFTVGGIALVIVVKLFFIEARVLWLILPFLVVLLGLLVEANRRVKSDGSVLVVLLLIVVGNWAIALAVSTIVPFLWPVMPLTVLMPVVLATPFLERSQLAGVVISGGFVAGAVAALGIFSMDRVMYDEIDETLELIIVISTLVAQVIPIGLIVWQNNRLQHENLDRANDLNRQLHRSQEDLAASRRRVVHAGDTERRRILKDLHDGAQQSLLAVGVRLRLLERETSHVPELQTPLEALIGELDAAIENVRDLAHGIYPPLLQSEGLVDAIGAAARGSTVPVRLRFDNISRLDPSVESALYFTALEALTNAAKHAPSSTVDLALVSEGQSLRLSVIDDGPGFIVDEQINDRASISMGDRVAAVGGDLIISSEVGVGTTIVATVPHVEAETP